MGSLDFTEDYYAYEIFYPEDPIDTLANIEFKECIFDGVSFEDTTITGCTFENCKFKACRWQGAIIEDSAILNSNFRFSSFFSTIFRNCKMIGSNFEDVDLSLIDIDGGIWTYTDLRRQDFSGKCFEKVDFSGADLTGCNFKKAKILHCNLSQARLNEVSFIEADIRGSNLYRTDLKATKLRKTKMDLEQVILLAEANGGLYTP